MNRAADRAHLYAKPCVIKCRPSGPAIKYNDTLTRDRPVVPIPSHRGISPGLDDQLIGKKVASGKLHRLQPLIRLAGGY